jgi:hypothetical protein
MLLIEWCSWVPDVESVEWIRRVRSTVSIRESAADNGVLIDLDTGVPTAQWAASSTFHQMTAVALKNDTKIRSMAHWSDWVCPTFQPSPSEIVAAAVRNVPPPSRGTSKTPQRPTPTEPTGNATPISWYFSPKNHWMLTGGSGFIIPFFPQFTNILPIFGGTK